MKSFSSLGSLNSISAGTRLPMVSNLAFWDILMHSTSDTFTLEEVPCPNRPQPRKLPSSKSMNRRCVHTVNRCWIPSFGMAAMRSPARHRNSSAAATVEHFWALMIWHSSDPDIRARKERFRTKRPSWTAVFLYTKCIDTAVKGVQ